MKVSLYFARLLLAAVFLTLLGLVVLVVAAGLIEGGGQLTQATSPVLTALRLGGLRAVEFSYHVLPAALFLATLITGTTLARRGELLAVYAMGMSVTRVAVVFVGVALGLAAVAVAAGEWVLPAVVGNIERVQREELGRADPWTKIHSERAAWFRRAQGDTELVLHLPSVDVEREQFLDPVFYLRRSGVLYEVLTGKRLAHAEGRWQLFDGERLEVRSGLKHHFDALSLSLDVKPADLIDVAGDPRQMSSRSLARIIDRRRAAELDTTAHEIELHSRRVQPGILILFVLLGVPWALSPSRHRALAMALGAGVVTIGVYLSVAYLFRILALGHHLPSLVGAFGGPLCAAGAVPVSFLLRRRVERRGSLW